MKDFKPSIVHVPIEQIKPYERNSKIHSEEQVLSIAKQIVKLGFDQPIVVEPDYTIIKGHGRLLAAQYLGMKEVPVIVQNVSKEDAKAARIADNKVAESPWDTEMLELEMQSLKEIESFDLTLTGFSDAEIKEMDGLLEPTVISQEDAFSKINATGERKDLQQMTFFLTEQQRIFVNSVLDGAYADLTTSGIAIADVPNKSGFALAHVCEKILAGDFFIGTGKSDNDQAD